MTETAEGLPENANPSFHNMMRTGSGLRPTWARILGWNLTAHGPVGDQTFDAIVLGAGAAGLMCAAVAGQRGRRVVVLERNREPGRKILISGGGRCNFTNLHCRAGTFPLRQSRLRQVRAGALPAG